MLTHIETPATASHIMGTSVMAESRLDIERAILPMNVSRPPVNWGTPSRGKLSANEWDILCLYFLPITLIRIWGYNTQKAAAGTDKGNAEAYRIDRFKVILHNYIDLVKAMLMVVNRISSDAHAASYRDHIRRHLQTLQKLFGHFHVKPVNHIAQHFDHFLSFMGPSYAYHVPGFERINFLLQNTNTNRKHGDLSSYSALRDTHNNLGEMEETMLNQFCETSGFVSLFKNDNEVNAVSTELLETYKEMEAERSLGLRLLSDGSMPRDGVVGAAALFEPDAELAIQLTRLVEAVVPTLPRPLYAARFDSIILNGWQYASKPKHLAGTFALVRHDATAEYAAQIEHILVVRPKNDNAHPGTTFLICKFYDRVTGRDVYSDLEMGFLTSRSPSDVRQILVPKHVVSALIATEMVIDGEEVVHMLPYDKVGIIYTNLQATLLTTLYFQRRKPFRLDEAPAIPVPPDEKENRRQRKRTPKRGR